MTCNVAVLGASGNPERYSYQAVVLLARHGHRVYPVHPAAEPVDGHTCYPDLAAIPDPVDTITVYLSERNSTPLIDAIIACHPRRVILNPGAENVALATRCQAAGIEVLEACTLVLVQTGQF